MGNGIAQVAACAGYEVTMIDIEQRFVDHGMASIESSLAKLVSKGRMDEEEAKAALSRVRACTVRRVRAGEINPGHTAGPVEL